MIALLAIAIPRRTEAQNIISSVDTTLTGSQKYVLRVGGQPYLLNDMQVRLDKLRYTSNYQWTWAQCDALMGTVAADGFNTVSLPIQWYEVEPQKDTFDWTVLDNYLSMVTKYNLKMEMLWFGANSTGSVQWLGDAANPVHLRTPDYVLYSPSYGSTATTSDYTIDRNYNPYTLALTDTNLLARETYVLGQVMAHIAQWDAANGLKHPVVGVQLNNEVNGGDYGSAGTVVGYLSGIGKAVKSSSYVVWTRSNTVDTPSLVSSRVAANLALKAGAGTNIDFIGIDDYSSDVNNIQSIMPIISGNFRMIMENSGTNPYALRLAALAGDTALDTYNMCGPDAGNGMYDQTSQGVCTPHGSFVSGVISNLKMLNTDPVDLALNSQGRGLYVHNWQTTGATTTGGTLSITYHPTSSSDEAISILRSNTEIVLMNTGGGTFTYGSDLQVTSASVGYFDSNNNWVSQGNAAFSSTSLTAPAFTTVRLTYTLPAPQTPTGLAVTSALGGSVGLTWNTAPYATSYNLKRSLTHGGPYTTVASGITATSYTDTGLTNGTTYYYVLSATGSVGESSNSAEVNGTPLGAVITVANYSFETPSTTSSVANPSSAGWTFNGAAPDGSGVTVNGYSFTQGSASAPDGSQVGYIQASGNISQALSGFNTGVKYVVTFLSTQRQSKKGGQTGETFDVQIDGNTIASFAPPQSTTTYTSGQAVFNASNTSHTLTFLGTNRNGGDNTIFLDNVYVTAVPPSTPTNLAVLPADSEMILSWTVSPGAAGYNVKRATVSGGPYTVVGSATTNSYIDATALDGTTYYYVVTAFNALGESASSNEVSGQPSSGLITVVNNSFETPKQSSGGATALPTNAAWTFVGGSSPNFSGISANGGNFQTGLAVAPDGTQVGYLEGLSSFSQAISGFRPGNSYTVVFLAAQRQSKKGGQLGQTFDLRVDGATVGSFAPPQASTTYGTYSASFTATSATHTIAFVATDLNTGDNTILLDKVQIRQSAGNIWVANGSGSLSGLTSGGTALTPSATSGGGKGILVDHTGNLWSLNQTGSSLAEFSNTGTLLNSSLAGGGINAATAFAIDGQGYIWLANGDNTLSVFNSTTASAVTSVAYHALTSSASTLSIDSSGNVWLTNKGDNTITKVVGVAAPVSTPLATSLTHNTVGVRP